MSLVSGCDNKIEAYNSSMEERIRANVNGALKIINKGGTMSKDGELWIDRTPLLPTPGSGGPHRQ